MTDPEDETSTTYSPDIAPGSGGGGSGGGGTGGVSTPEVPATTGGLNGVLPENLSEEAPLTAEQQAERAAFYDELWEEQAAHDPLGRSADELRIAWENRETIVLDESLLSGKTTLGYGETSPIAKPAVNLSIVTTAQGASA